ncbi:hypothetical protein WAX74_20030 [Psychrobacillus sp. FJAT-51614]|uniref:Copper amine oxidase-like N-terminal domain-containing protein n=1 Tax=Psychrobacillus mangrovi TaxID=3117745 RepID=A0ABU8FA67_9BACI
MNRILEKLAIFTLIILLVPMGTKASTAEKVVGNLPEAELTLYATEKEGDLTNFKLTVKGETYFFPRWLNSPNITYYPKLYYSDINNDGRKEIVIVLTTDTGTGVIIQEPHVFHVDNNGDLLEKLVDNPMAIINKNVKTKLSSSKAIVSIGKEKNKINIRELNIVPSHIFENVAIGSTLRFEVIDNKFVAIVGLTIAPAGGSIGEIHIIYTFKDNMYQAKQINFIPRDESE